MNLFDLVTVIVVGGASRSISVLMGASMQVGVGVARHALVLRHRTSSAHFNVHDTNTMGPHNRLL
jgi:hypothetical protein